MSTRLSLTALLLAAVLSLAGIADARSGPDVPYPSGYRSWTHVKSMWLSDAHGLADPFAGLHHVYVNDAGAAALERGNPLPEGTIFAFDLLEAAPADEALVEGPRKLLGVMLRDTRRFRATGGWGFEAFARGASDQRLVTDGGAGCFACHASQEANGYVFSTWRP